MLKALFAISLLCLIQHANAEETHTFSKQDIDRNLAQMQQEQVDLQMMKKNKKRENKKTQIYKNIEFKPVETMALPKPNK